jgi:hypothetical protein
MLSEGRASPGTGYWKSYPSKRKENEEGQYADHDATKERSCGGCQKTVFQHRKFLYQVRTNLRELSVFELFVNL